jgi:phage terminase small subunit
VVETSAPESSLLKGGTAVMSRGMTYRQRRFVEEFMVDFDGKAAAIRAGFAPKGAKEQAYRLRNLPHVHDAIEAAMAEASKRTGINQERVLRVLARIGLANPLDVVDALDATVKEGASREDTAAIQSIKVKVTPQRVSKGEEPIEPIIEREIRMYDKPKALELLGKHFGMFTDKLDVNLPITVVIKDDYGDDDGGGHSDEGEGQGESEKKPDGRAE